MKSDNFRYFSTILWAILDWLFTVFILLNISFFFLTFSSFMNTTLFWEFASCPPSKIIEVLLCFRESLSFDSVSFGAGLNYIIFGSYFRWKSFWVMNSISTGWDSNLSSTEISIFSESLYSLFVISIYYFLFIFFSS